MSTICILLSTFNGERYLKEQLDSLSLQEGVDDVLLYARDDGSKDTTVNVLREYAKVTSKLKIIIEEGENVGVHKSFLKTLYEAPKADFYAYCDQDDYWHPQKLEKAVKSLSTVDGPALFYSGYEVVDCKLNKLFDEPINYQTHKSVTQILFENKVPGCVMVFNQALRDKVLSIKGVEAVNMHDAYTLCIAYLTGKIISEKNPLIKYRQHSSNALGYGNKHQSIRKWLRHKWMLLKYGDGYDLSDVAHKVLEQLAEECSNTQKKELETISLYKKSFISKVRLLTNRDILSENNKPTSVSIFFRILFNII